LVDEPICILFVHANVASCPTLQAVRLAHGGLLPTNSLPASAPATSFPPAQAALLQQGPAATQLEPTASVPAPAAASSHLPGAGSVAFGASAGLTYPGGAAVPAVVAGLQRAAVTITASPARGPAPSRVPGGGQGNPSAGQGSLCECPVLFPVRGSIWRLMECAHPGVAPCRTATIICHACALLLP
jgi:hypothetical protein